MRNLWGKLLAWLPAILVAAAIFMFSHQPADKSTMASNGMSQMILNLAGKLKIIDLTNADIMEICSAIATPVRKCAHMTEFAVLDVSLIFALWFWGKRGRELLEAAFVMAFVYAGSDEFHQLFIPGRAGLAVDVLVDSIGLAAATLGAYFWPLIFLASK